MSALIEDQRPAQQALRPITMAILAMGGEGGGVLSDWTVALAEANGYYAQSTSVPGVAQRTGATVYYVELLPKVDDRYPVLSTMPTPGEVDIVVASELMEAGRAVQRGFATPDRTTLIASTSRTYAMPERTAMGDGRVDTGALIEQVSASSRRFVRGDFAGIADRNRSVISAVLFGALAGSGALPFTREQFENAIREGGKGVEASLRAFDEAYRVASAPPPVDIQIGLRPREVDEKEKAEAALRAHAASDPASMVGPRLTGLAQRIATEFPPEARWMLVNGIKRTAEYQDDAYAEEYLDRVASVVPFESNGSSRLTDAVARYTALWMTYEDTIRVAFHKTRERRFARVRENEARAKDEQMVQIFEFLHPQVEEIADTAPTALGRWILNSRMMNRIILRITHKGLKLQTTSVWGFTVLSTLARMRPIRRRSLRFGLEQERIERWLDAIRGTARSDYALACEIAELQQLIKGYGETHARGMASYTAIMERLPEISAKADPAATMLRLRKAALADESGEPLKAALAAL